MDHVNETAFVFSGPPYPCYCIALRRNAPFIAGHGFIPQHGSNFLTDHYIPIQRDVQKRLVQPTESLSYPSSHWSLSKKFRPGHAKSFGQRAAHGWLPLQIPLWVSITPGRTAQDGLQKFTESTQTNIGTNPNNNCSHWSLEVRHTWQFMAQPRNQLDLNRASWNVYSVTSTIKELARLIHKLLHHPQQSECDDTGEMSNAVAKSHGITTPGDNTAQTWHHLLVGAEGHFE